MVLQRSKGPRRHSTNRSLTGWVVAFGCSVLADQVFFLSLTWAAVQLDVPGLVGIVLAAGTLPRLLVLLVGGALADAKSPKRILIGADSGRALIMAAAAAVLLLGSMNAWMLVAVAVAVGTLDGLFLPAVAALPVRIAPAQLMGRVAALRTIAQRVGMLGGGPLAGWLIYLYGPSAAFLGSAVLFTLSVSSFALVTLTPRTLPAPAAEEPAAIEEDPAARRRRPLVAKTWADTTAGFQVVRHSPVLTGLLVLIGGMNLGFAGPFTAGIPLLAVDNGWGARGAGLLIGSFGIGAAVSGLGLLLVKHVPRAGTVQLVAVLSMGLSIGAVGLVPDLVVALAAIHVLGVASGVFGTVAYALLLNVTPAGEVGRVMALLSLILEGSAAVSFLVTGTVATAIGADGTFLLGGLLIVLTTLACTVRPHLRRLQLSAVEPASQDDSVPAS